MIDILLKFEMVVIGFKESLVHVCICKFFLNLQKINHKHCIY